MAKKTVKNNNGNKKIGKKEVKIAENPNNYFSKNPVWRFSNCDTNHEKWSFSSSSIDDNIFDKLKSFESMTWNEILSQSGGRKNGTNSHFIEIDKLCSEAQKRLEEKNIDTDQVFSLRLTGTQRIFGILNQGVFNIIWRDDNHEICPSNKK